MSSPLANPSFRSLFAAQICSLVGVGILTVALSLMAFRLGGPVAGGQVLGLLLALKMVAYVVLAPLAETLLSRVSRRRAMVGLDVGRMLLLLPMAYVSATWQLAALSFGFFVLAAGFTPLFQSVIPDVLPDEKTYTRALAWSRIAYTLEAVLSPVIAAALLNVLAEEMLFYAAALALAGSVVLLLITRLPRREGGDPRGPFLKRAGRGLNIYLRTPRLRGLCLLNFALSLAMAWVLVNTVVYAGARLGDAQRYFPILMAFYGLGAGIAAVFIPALLHRLSERSVMLLGTFGFAAVGAALAVTPQLPLAGLGAVWVAFGVTSTLVLTPGGLVITRSATADKRAALFAAQFSLSHAGWLIAYPLAGWLAAQLSLEMSLLILCAACAIVSTVAMAVWPAHDPMQCAHSHPEIDNDHPHLAEFPLQGAQRRHTHVLYIDELHPVWPKG